MTNTSPCLRILAIAALLASTVAVAGCGDNPDRVTSSTTTERTTTMPPPPPISSSTTTTTTQNSQH